MDKRINIRIDKDLKLKLEKQAKKEHTTMSTIIKRLLVQYLEN